MRFKNTVTMTLSKLKRDVFKAITKALKMTKERLEKAQGSKLFCFVYIQFDKIERLIKQPLAITVDDAQQIKLVLMAVREFGQEEQDQITKCNMTPLHEAIFKLIASMIENHLPQWANLFLFSRIKMI